ncbi:hypothetical protein, partial [Neisseria sicca]|uniref:hypothetical protein n=1 Tax=Neisseria sicca TaxID=490 RepID=UPI001C993603
QGGVVGGLFKGLGGRFGGLWGVCDIEYVVKNKLCKGGILKRDLCIWKYFVCLRGEMGGIL